MRLPVLNIHFGDLKAVFIHNVRIFYVVRVIKFVFRIPVLSALLYDCETCFLILKEEYDV
jgi:hypothetical protein